MSRTNCEHCNALVTPGASFCLSCFVPFEDDAPAVPPQAMPASVGAPAPVAVGAQAGGPHDFYAAPPFQHHPGQHVDWRVNAPTAALLTQRPRKSKVPLIAGAVLGLVVLLGIGVVAKAVLVRPSEKQQLATAFREARPPEFLPDFSGLGSILDDREVDPEGPGEAQAFVQAMDRDVRAANAAILDLQRSMDRWADGKVSDDELRTQIKGLTRMLGELTGIEVTVDAPQSTQRGLAKLTQSAVEYKLALNALLDWMDSQTGGSRLSYRMSIGDANLHWDEGLINLYRAAGMPPPALPHPQPEK